MGVCSIKWWRLANKQYNGNLPRSQSMEDSLYSQFSIGGDCDGAGILVNSTLNDGTLYCLCDAYTSGKGDFFDSSHVAADGTLSLTCTNSRIGEIFAWSIVLISMVYRFISVFQSFLSKFAAFKAQHNGSNYTWRQVYNVFALRIFLIDMVTVALVLIATSCLKITGQTIGTDIPVTVLYIFGVSSFQIGSMVLADKELIVLTSFLPSDKKTNIRWLHRRIQIVSSCAYVLGVGVPSIMALTLDKSLGPWENGEYICLLTRNLFVVVWCSFSLCANDIIYKRFQYLLSSLIDEQSTGAMQKMRASRVLLARLYMLISLLALVFCIPYIWGYQTYSLATMVALGARRHPAQAFQSDTSKKSNSNNNQHHKGTVAPVTEPTQQTIFMLSKQDSMNEGGSSNVTS